PRPSWAPRPSRDAGTPRASSSSGRPSRSASRITTVGVVSLFRGRGDGGQFSLAARSGTVLTGRDGNVWVGASKSNAGAASASALLADSAHTDSVLVDSPVSDSVLVGTVLRDSVLVGTASVSTVVVGTSLVDTAAGTGDAPAISPT